MPRALPLPLLLLLVLGGTNAKMNYDKCEAARARWSASCGGLPDHAMNGTNVVLLLVGHTRAFMTDRIISTSLRVNVIERLKNQNISPWLAAHVKMQAHNKHVTSVANITERLKSIGARTKVDEDIEVVDYASCRRDLAHGGETYCHDPLRCPADASATASRRLSPRSLNLHACLDQQFSHFRVLQMLRRLEAREGFTADVAMRQRVDVFWPLPMPDLCHFSRTSWIGFSDYIGIFPRSLIGEMGNAWRALVKDPPSLACEDGQIGSMQLQRTCGTARPEDVYHLHMRNVPFAECWPFSWLFEASTPRIHRGWERAEQESWELLLAEKGKHPHLTSPGSGAWANPRFALLGGPFAACLRSPRCITEAQATGIDLGESGNGIHPAIAGAIREAGDAFRARASDHTSDERHHPHGHPN